MKKVIAAVMIMMLVCVGLSGAMAEQSVSSEDEFLQQLREAREAEGPERQELMRIVEEIHYITWENQVVAHEINEDGTAQMDLYIDVSENRPTYYFPWIMNWITQDELEERNFMTLFEQQNTVRKMKSKSLLVNHSIAQQNDGKDNQTNSGNNYVLFSNENEEVAITFEHDEAYLYYSYDWVTYDQNTGDVLNVRTIQLVTDQDAVGQVAEFAYESGIAQLPEIRDWLERHRSESFEASEQPEGEIQIEQPDAQENAVDGNFVGKVVIRQEGNVNVRKKSNADSAKVGTAKAGAVYPCLSVADNGWFEIQLENGTVGFVSPKMASLVE